MLHAAAGRAFARSSAREYHPTSHTKDAAVVASRRKEKKISGKDDRAAFVHVITRTPSPPFFPSLPVSSPSLSHSEISIGSSCNLDRFDGSAANCTDRNASLDASQAAQRSPVARRPLPAAVTTHSPSVVPINVEALSTFDIAFVDPGRSLMPSYKDDPPWSEIVKMLHDSARSTVATTETAWAPPFTLLTSTTTRSLYLNLLRITANVRPLMLTELINYHSRWPSLQSTRSFNFLIALCIRHNHLAATRNLFLQMDARGIPGNIETRKLRVRFWIRKGHWRSAWRHENAVVGGIPFPVWLEFFGPQGRSTAHKMELGSDAKQSEAGSEFVVPPHKNETATVFETQGGNTQSPCWPVNGATPPDRGGRVQDPVGGSRDSKSDVTADIARFRLLMNKLPSVRPDQWAPPSPRATRSVISMLHRCKQHEMAHTVTMNLFRNLPARLDRRLHFQCLDLIHFNLSKSRENGLPGFYRNRALLKRMLRAHASFRPDSTTLFLLLRPLKTALKCGTIAEHTVRLFQDRWGSKVVDERVRRRLVSLAVKEGRTDIVESFLTEQQYASTQRQLWNLVREVRGGPVTAVSGRRARQPDKTLAMFVRQKKNERLFRRVMLRLERKRSRIGRLI